MENRPISELTGAVAVAVAGLEISGVCVEQSEFLHLHGICHLNCESAANRMFMVQATEYTACGGSLVLFPSITFNRYRRVP